MNPLREKGRTFTLDMGSDGAASLQKVILEKLTEFMGDYTDDVLAQYILVLVAHGKQQAQAVKDLEAFLGDRSESFVAWLWDYLCSNLHLHASVSKASVLGGNGAEHKVQQADNGRVKVVQADVQVLSSKIKHGEKTRHSLSNTKMLPDLNNPPPQVGNIEIEIDSESDKSESKDRSASRHSRHTVKRPRSPFDSRAQKERKRRSDVKHHRKRHTSLLSVNATCRLLQSAVREAVGPIASLTKSGSKRLRSVVSAEVDDLEDRNTDKNVVKADDVRQEKEASPIMPVYPKAAASIPQKDNGGPVGNVWDRLGRTAKHRKDEGLHGDLDFHSLRMDERRFTTHMDDEKNDRKLSVHQLRLSTQDLNERNGRAAEKTIGGGLDNVCKGGHSAVHVKEANVPNHMRFQHFRGNDTQEMVGVGMPKIVDVECKGASYANGPVRSANTETGEAQDATLAMPSSKQLVFSQMRGVSSQGQEPVMEQLQTQPEGDSNKYVLELRKRLDQIQMEMMKLRARQLDSNKETQNATSSGLPGTEEVPKMQDSLQSRTVFVTNIHFAATKESIMVHFAQCGKVEQVVVLTDAATGKPKGSAYVEFSMQAEADRALTLNETSFFSRILKVAPTDSSNIQEILSSQSASIRHPNSLPSKPSTRGRAFRSAQNSLGYASMRAAYATPTKLQWKREITATGGSPPAANGVKPGGQGLSIRPVVKSFTYVRNHNAPTAKAGVSEGQKGAT